MLRRLTIDDREELLSFISGDEVFNTFIYGDIETYGFDNKEQDIWGIYKGNELEGTLLRLNEHFLPYWKKEEFNPAEFADIIEGYRGKAIMTGMKRVIDSFDGF